MTTDTVGTRPAEPRDRESGMALIVVLWTLLLLGVIAASLGGQARKRATSRATLPPWRGQRRRPTPALSAAWRR